MNKNFTMVSGGLLLAAFVALSGNYIAKSLIPGGGSADHDTATALEAEMNSDSAGVVGSSPAEILMEEGDSETEVTAVADAGSGEVSDEPIDYSVLVASGDVVAGEKVFKKCKACHGASEDSPHKVGPNLWGVAGGPIGTAEGYKYSRAFEGLTGQNWNAENLWLYLTSPKKFVKGTKMTFAGLKKDEELADVIAYLNAAGGSL